MFIQQISKMMEVYVADILAKSLHVVNHLTHLKVLLDALCSYNIKLNPNKCTFGIF